MNLSLFQVNWRDTRYTNHSESVDRIVAIAGANNGELAAILRESRGATAEVIHAQELFQDVLAKPEPKQLKQEPLKKVWVATPIDSPAKAVYASEELANEHEKDSADDVRALDIVYE